MHRMIRGGSRRAQDAALAPGIDQAPRNLALELIGRHVVGAGGDEEEPPWGDERRGQAGELAITAGALLQLLLRFNECRRVGDHDAEIWRRLAEALQLLEGLGAAEAATASESVELRRLLGQCQRRIGAIEDRDL